MPFSSFFSEDATKRLNSNIDFCAYCLITNLRRASLCGRRTRTGEDIEIEANFNLKSIEKFSIRDSIRISSMNIMGRIRLRNGVVYYLYMVMLILMDYKKEKKNIRKSL